ncbi:helix-turn-helix domain-containing protein [Actinosynnema sp. NPDC047251]|uniref:TetR/AcrR family transcriptional regulator n=1 Tax=Saccharothrix espanaensis TaxID=103731 RepID=UPI0002DC5A1F|nr:helix-turn-helix domain-containing protein [Saccharothrix espanaensis]
MERPLRADARRNRARVLEVAAHVFATEGLSVPVHEIARRAGVGTGTVSRHFPTKDDLVTAVLRTLTADLVAEADALAASEDPGGAFFAFLGSLVRSGAAHRGLARELTGGCGERRDVEGRTRALLARAQEAGAVRPDVCYADVKALLTGCMVHEGGPLEPVIGVLRDGLRHTTPPREDDSA